MIVKVKYFDIEKYEADWKKYFSTNLVRWIGLSPTDKGFSPYLKEVEVKTEKFIKHKDIAATKISVFDYIVEIDNDYLYHDIAVGYYISLSNLVDLTNGVFGQIERELKLKTIIDD